MGKNLFAKRMDRLGTESAFEVLAKAKKMEAEGMEVIHMEIGEPDFDTPQNIVDKGCWALQNGFTHYNPSAGVMEVRETVADYLTKTRGIPYEKEEIVMGPGGKPLIAYAIMACVDEGEEVLIPNPTYPAYESITNFIGAKSVPIPILEEKDFRFDVKELEKYITPKTKMMVVNSPQNPTGGVLSPEDLEHIAGLAKKHDFLILSDEIYSRMLYDGHKHHSIASLPGMKERTILMDGFSKTYAMTGWRLGYIGATKEIADRISKLTLNIVSCTATFTQIAGMEALTGPQGAVDEMCKEFVKRRDLIVDGLNAIDGITCRKPLGAFYVFPNVKSFGRTSKELAVYLLEEAGIACLWGTAFGIHGEGYIRLSYANSVENIKKALDKIERALKKLPAKV
ncbi:MAG: pyridoxal phosphate-dependent aminotransferase [Armatimonadota bacterium]